MRQAFTIPPSPKKPRDPNAPPRARKSMKVGKKLEAIEEAFCKLPLENPAQAEATFKALAAARGVSEATYNKRWAMVWHLAKRLCKAVV